LQFDAKGAITGSTTPDWVGDKIFAAIGEKQNPEVNWADIDAPRLGIFNQPSVQGKLPYYWYLSSDEQRVFDANWPGIVQWYADTTEKFEQANTGKPTPVVYLLPNAPHYFFMNDQAFVVRRMREFLLGKVGPWRRSGLGCQTTKIFCKARAIEIAGYFPLRERFCLNRLNGCRDAEAILFAGDLHINSFGRVLSDSDIQCGIVVDGYRTDCGRRAFLPSC
jgi:hypothetical protein